MEERPKTNERLSFCRKSFSLAKIFSTDIEYNYFGSTRWLHYKPLEQATELYKEYNGIGNDRQRVFNEIPIGFNFSFNGTNYEEVSICENGYIKMCNVIALSTRV